MHACWYVYVHTYVCTRVCVFVQCVCLRGHVLICQRFCVRFLYCTGECVYERLCTLHSVCMCVCVRGCTRTCVSVCACMGASLLVRMCVVCVTLQNTLHTYSFTHTHTHSNTIWVWTAVLPSWLSRGDRSIPPQCRRNKWRVTRCRLA